MNQDQYHILMYRKFYDSFVGHDYCNESYYLKMFSDHYGLSLDRAKSIINKGRQLFKEFQ